MLEFQSVSLDFSFELTTYTLLVETSTPALILPRRPSSLLSLQVLRFLAGWQQGMVVRQIEPNRLLFLLLDLFSFLRSVGLVGLLSPMLVLTLHSTILGESLRIFTTSCLEVPCLRFLQESITDEKKERAFIFQNTSAEFTFGQGLVVLTLRFSQGIFLGMLGDLAVFLIIQMRS